MKIVVDRQKCIGAADCVEEAPAVFELDSFGKAVVVKPETTDRDRVLAAARSCPVDAITVFDEDGKQLYP